MSRFNAVNCVVILSFAILTLLTINACKKSVDAPFQGTGGQFTEQSVNTNNLSPMQSAIVLQGPLVMSPEEYATADVSVQQLADQTQVAVNQMYSLVNTPGVEGEMATFTFTPGAPAGPITVVPAPPTDPINPLLECKICNALAAYGCIGKFKDYVKSGHSTFKIQVQVQSNGCVLVKVVEGFQVVIPGGLPPIKVDPGILNPPGGSTPPFHIDPGTINPDRPTFPIDPTAPKFPISPDRPISIPTLPGNTGLPIIKRPGFPNIQP